MMSEFVLGFDAAQMRFTHGDIGGCGCSCLIAKASHAVVETALLSRDTV